ncbi:MAG TPA: PHP domain-containing protein [Anaerolineales bacterium]
MLRVEFHCHTVYSKDSLCSPETLLAASRRKGLDRVIITDHNSIAGALHAGRLDPERVIVGEEIMTRDGELLAAFVTEEVPAGLHPLEAIARLRDQGAFISVSHPFDRLRSGHWRIHNLMKILDLVDAIETFNARCIWPGFNWEAQAFAQKHQLLGTAGSDAHAAFEVGQASLLLPIFQDASSLKQAISSAQHRLALSWPWVHLASSYAKWYKRHSTQT